MIVLDTTVISELLQPAPPRPAPQVEARLVAAQDRETVWPTALGQAELRHGAARLPADRRAPRRQPAVQPVRLPDRHHRPCPRGRCGDSQHGRLRGLRARGD
jgi:predicted nucleic acid-binding protein